MKYFDLKFRLQLKFTTMFAVPKAYWESTQPFNALLHFNTNWRLIWINAGASFYHKCISNSSYCPFQISLDFNFWASFSRMPERKASSIKTHFTSLVQKCSKCHILMTILRTRFSYPLQKNQQPEMAFCTMGLLVPNELLLHIPDDIDRLWCGCLCKG